MRTLSIASIAAFILAAAVSLMSAETPAYIGASKCKMCHNSKAKGEQFNKWKAESHSKAFETLKNDQSKAIAKKMGIADATTDPKCLKCHIADAAIKDDGVTCESCHGPGSLYKPVAIMKNKTESMKRGLVDPDEKVCLKCHNTESPTYKKFVFKEAVTKVTHPNPANVKK
ncbi:MAG: cytochrome c family protein [Fibrobacterota bacterium]